MQSTLEGARVLPLAAQLRAWLELNPTTHQVRACAELRAVAIDGNETSEVDADLIVCNVHTHLTIDDVSRVTRNDNASLHTQSHRLILRTPFVTVGFGGVAHAYTWAEVQDHRGIVRRMKTKSHAFDLRTAMWS